MKHSFIVVIMLCTASSLAQNFQKKIRVATPIALNKPVVQWVDADNDSLLDIAIATTTQNQIKIIFLKNLGHDSFSPTQTLATGYQNGVFTLTDFNHDNKIDIVVSGKSSNGDVGTDVFLNQGNFNFQKANNKIYYRPFSQILFVDLNNDGIKDLIASANDTLFVYQQANGQFIQKMDTAIHATSVRSFDVDNNGFHDIVFSGIASNNRPTTGVLLLRDKFKILKKIQIKSINGNIEAGDLNHDGLFDLTISGKDSTGVAVMQAFQNGGSKFTPLHRISNIDSVDARIADFTSDGKSDMAFFQKSLATRKSWIKTFTGDSVSIDATNLYDQSYGDYDRDGDLDLLQLRSDSIFVFQNNEAAVNQGPSPIVSQLAVQLLDRIFFYWNKSNDDHTITNSLTYDLRLYDQASNKIDSEFDQTTRQRLLVTHGNMGTANYSLQKQKVTETLFYQLQSIDNSFAVQTKLPLGGGQCQKCVDITTDNVTLCSSDAQVQLKPKAPNAMWFSFNKGYLGIHDSLSYSKSESDTIFSFNPNSALCSSIKLFLIDIKNTDTLRIAHSLTNCENSQNLLKVATEWTSVTWKNSLNSSVAVGSQLNVVLTNPATYSAIGSNSHGCKLKETFNMKISKPNLKVNPDQFRIIKRGSAQLHASGASSYSWSPAEGLNNSTIDSPIASPLKTTEYQVIAKDTLGCTASATVMVEVMEEGFIPTLFTPNGDGKNDTLKIFGLGSVANFRFTIYNREGNVMYDTQDVATATAFGWSGESHGQMQPTGTYYWKVEGDNSSGDVTLNGKKSGAFLLVR